VGKLFLALGNTLSNPSQDALPLECRKPSGRAKSLDRSRNGSLCVLTPSLKHSADNASVVRCSNFDRVAFFNPFTIEEKSVGCDWSCNHLGHTSSSTPHKQ
jgi:hypothetical protein